ncbi:hypothetical protein L1049_002246 [Liquidambar formosana]|uniref:FKB95-like N-terminal Kelch domain-containing protein n=1 Tax=Liquidambar formosana TaxID=63359 RepID=A0AAP0NGS6_LIQFO
MSSSSPSSLEKEKSIFLRAQKSVWDENGKIKQTRWQLYILDTPRTTSSEAAADRGDNRAGQRLRLFSEMPPCFPSNSGCVALESVIYVLGGHEKTTSPEVFYLDTRFPNTGWKKGPSMNRGRSEPHGAVINGNIYVMGDCNNSFYGDNSPDSPDNASSEPWVEVLDPFLSEWKTLPSHPQLPYSGISSIVVIDSGKKILVHPSPSHQSKSLFSYDVKEKSWDLIDKEFSSKFHDFQTPCVVLDDVLYYFSRRVRAYDLAKREWFEEPVRGLEGIGVSPPLQETNGYGSPEANFPRAFLVHVGNGKLCLVWEAWGGSYKRKNIHCTKFRVSKQSDEGGETILWAIIESLTVYPTDDVHRLVDCLAI